jgi:hypothetical protein
MKNMNQEISGNAQEFIAMIVIYYLVASMIYQSKAQYVFSARIVKIYIYHLIQNIKTSMVIAIDKYEKKTRS